MSARALNSLQRLIQGRLRERGWSYGEVARRSALPRSTVYSLATTRNLARPPRPATLNALAKGLDVPVAELLAAAGRVDRTARRRAGRLAAKQGFALSARSYAATATNATRPAG